MTKKLRDVTNKKHKLIKWDITKTDPRYLKKSAGKMGVSVADLKQMQKNFHMPKWW